MTEEEYKKYSSMYLKLYYAHKYIGELSEDEYVTQELPLFLENLYCSMILNNYYWGIWSILMINEKEINNKIFNFGYAKMRIELADFLMTQDYVRDAVESKVKKYQESK